MATPYDTIDSIFVKQYSDTFVAMLGKVESALFSTVTNIGSVTGTSFTANEIINDLGTPTTGVERFGATQYSDVSFASRLAIMNDFASFTRQAPQDFYKLKADPTDRQLTYLHQKWNKHLDKTIYNALLGSSQRKVTGADTYTAVPLPAKQILGDVLVAPTKKLLIDVRTKFLENEVDEEIYITYNASLLNAILADKELTSADYLAGQMLQRGEISSFLGFNWVHTEAIKSADGLSATGVAYTRSAVEIGTNTISPLSMKEVETQNRMVSIGHIEAVGCTRVSEERVVAFKFKV